MRFCVFDVEVHLKMKRFVALLYLSSLKEIFQNGDNSLKNFYFFKEASALATTFSTVKAKCVNNALAGPDTPKLVIATISPFSPAYLYQLYGEPASTQTLAFTFLGSTLSL